MKRVLCIAILVCLLSAIIPVAFATTVEGLIDSLFSSTPAQITVADPAAFFGQSSGAGDTEIAGLILGPYSIYQGVKMEHMEGYIQRMKELGFVAVSTEYTEKGVTQWQFDQGSFRVVLLYSQSSGQVVLIYPKDSQYVSDQEIQASSSADSGKALSVPVFTTKAPEATAEPANAHETAAGYAVVEVDGVERTFVQTRTEKSIDFVTGAGNWTVYFDSYNVRGDKEYKMQLMFRDYAAPGDSFTTQKSIDNLDIALYVIFYDRDGTFCMATTEPALFDGLQAKPSGSNYELYIDSMSEDGYTLLGHFNAVVGPEYGNKRVKLENGRFQFTMHQGSEDGYDWVK